MWSTYLKQNQMNWLYSIILTGAFALPNFFPTGWNCSLRANLSNSFSECIHQHFHVSVGSSNTYTKYYQQTAPRMMKIDDLPKGKDFNWQLLIRPGQMCFEIFFSCLSKRKIEIFADFSTTYISRFEFDSCSLKSNLDSTLH